MAKEKKDAFLIVRIPDTLKKVLLSEAKRMKKTLSRVVREILEKEINY